MEFQRRHLVLAAIVGLVLGLLLGRIPHRHGPEARARHFARLSRRLELTPDQAGKIKAAFERGGLKMDVIRAETRREARALMNDAQRAKFDAITANRDKREGRVAPPENVAPAAVKPK